MASLTKHHGGWLIQYMADGKRNSYYPGKMPKRDAQAAKRHIENLASARKQGTAVCDETCSWLKLQDFATRLKLYEHGLIEKPVEAVQGEILGPFVEAFIISRSDVKESTRTVWKRCQKHLVGFLGKDREMQTIDTSTAKDFRSHLLKKGLSENTVRKMCSVASQFFADALDRELISRNPFNHKTIPRTVRENKTRDCIVTREMADKVIEACPDAQWRLLFALSRYGGLRCPSEHMELKWSDILWDKNRIIVTSPKTAHHEGKEQRVIPIFPELRPHLEAAFEEAEPGTLHCITRYRNAETNLRTQLHRIILKAGLVPWPKIFHNLRATRETELAEQFPIQTVCAWIGNSVKIASRHYLQVTDEHFDRASDAMHYAMQNVTESKRTNENGKKSNRRKPFPDNV